MGQPGPAMLLNEPLDRLPPLLVGGAVPGHLDGWPRKATPDPLARVGVRRLGGDVLYPTSTGQLLDVSGDAPEDGDDALMGGIQPR